MNLARRTSRSLRLSAADSVTSPSSLSSIPSGHPAPGALIVTPCPWTARTLEVALRESGFATLRTADATVAADLCNTGTIDAVIVDERIFVGSLATDAGRGGALLRAAASVPVLPVLLLTQDSPIADSCEPAFAAGIWGIAPYPFGASHWIRQLRVWADAGAEGRRRLDSGLVDTMTGLYNSQGLEHRARDVEAAARRRGGALSCAVLSVNVAVPGDGAPTARAPELDGLVADAWRRVGRASDVFARVGAAEFALIAPGADAANVETLIGRLREALRAATDADLVLRAGVFGVADAQTASDTVLDLLARAAGRC